MTKGGDSKKEKEQIEKKIISILQNKEETLEQLESHISQLKQKEIQLEEDIKLKKIEVERGEKRLESIVDTQPKEDSEQRELENELQQLFRIYVEKIRNNDYLESKLVEFNEIERIREKIQEAEARNIKDEVFKNEQAEIFDDNENVENNEIEDEPYNYKKTQDLKREQLMSRANNRQQQKFNNDDEDGEDMEQNEDEEDEDDQF